MSNIRILRYEIKMLLTRKYLYTFLALSLFCYDVLTRLIITGAAGTAPFSRLSYSNFAALINPMLLAALVLICTGFFSSKEVAARRIIFSTPVTHASYYLLKSAAAAIVYVFTAALMILFSFVFYIVVFNFYSFGDFVIPIAAFMIPPFLFVLGLSMVLGRFNVKALYLLIPAVFFAGMMNLRLPVWLDLCGNNFLEQYVFTVRAVNFGDALPYILPPAFICSRIVISLLGIFLLFAASFV